MALKQIKNKIVSTKKTGKVTKAMQAVSAVKMRKSQERALKSRPYASTALQILKKISDVYEPAISAYMGERAEGKDLYIIVTSDKGLAGSVNSAVLKKAEILLGEGELDLICVGRKAVEFGARTKNAHVVGSFTNIADDVTIADVYEIAEVAFTGFQSTVYRKVGIIYQNFVSTFEQKPVLRQILPLSPETLESTISDIAPKKGKFAETVAKEHAPTTKVYTIEPNAEEVLRKLIPQLVEIMVFHALIENKASEHSARMVAMKNATDNSKELTKKLTLVYNKERQAAITAEVSEITGGMEALKT